MSDPIHVAVICEGLTERLFVETILAPHFGKLSIYLTPTLLTKKGGNGGDVKYNRLFHDLENHLRQSHYHCVTSFLDFYGLADYWPGYEEAKKKQNPAEKQKTISDEVKRTADGKLEAFRSFERFLPHFVMHEIEALYFSCPLTLANALEVSVKSVEEILSECGEPEAINHTIATSPSHRLEGLMGKNFKKTSTGISIAKSIGLQKIRESCPLFDQWIERLEQLSVTRKLS